MVLYVLAGDAPCVLGKTASWKEKLVLGGAAFYDDITVTRTDKEYFEKQCETRFSSDLCSEAKNEDQKKQIAFSKCEGSAVGFRPMYYTHAYEEDPRMVEMSFNCSNYQHQLENPNLSSGDAYDPVHQTIFLDKNQRHLWTIDDIGESNIIKQNWWHQLGHRWQHYVRVVPGMMFLHGKNSTWFAGSWTYQSLSETCCWWWWLKLRMASNLEYA